MSNKSQMNLLQTNRAFLRMVGICDLSQGTNLRVIIRNKLFGLFLALNLFVGISSCTHYAIASMRNDLLSSLQAISQISGIVASIVTMICMYFDRREINQIFNMIQNFGDTSKEIYIH